MVVVDRGAGKEVNDFRGVLAFFRDSGGCRPVVNVLEADIHGNLELSGTGVDGSCDERVGRRLGGAEQSRGKLGDRA